jgi:flagellar motor protein MotB
MPSTARRALRAIAVRQHLVFFYDISSDRLAAVGYGKKQLLDPSSPESGVNRRVQIVNEGH